MSGRSRAGNVRWRALAGLLGLACAASCNALTGVNELQFRDSPRSGSRAEGEADAGADAAPITVIGSLQGGCNALTGRGCPEGQACRFHRELGVPGCQPLPAAPLQPYAACRQDEECAAPYLCEGGVCSKPCESSADCGWADARCLATLDGALRRCSRGCDLVRALAPRPGLQACGEGTRCDFVPEPGTAGYTDCFPESASALAGSPCLGHADCPSDFRCEHQLCTPACGPDVPCPGGLRCGGSSEQLASQRVAACCNLAAGQACDLLTGCGCAPGSTCSSEGEVVTCRALPAQPKAPYASCEQNAECPAGHSCIEGVCKLHCNVAADCGSAGAACVPLTFEGVAVPGVAFCARGCDVVSPQAPAAGWSACAAGATCVETAPDLGGTDCSEAGVGSQGAECALAADCAPGFGCFDESCERWCTAGGTECGLGLLCNGARDVGGRRLGSCCAPPLDQACDWLTDCGCDPADTCSVDDEALRFCRPISDTPVPAYAACDTETQCPRSHHCAFGACMARCETSADCAAGTQCLVLNEADPGTGICSRNCDMLSPSPGARLSGVWPRSALPGFRGPGGRHHRVCLLRQCRCWRRLHVHRGVWARPRL